MIIDLFYSGLVDTSSIKVKELGPTWSLYRCQSCGQSIYGGKTFRYTFSAAGKNLTELYCEQCYYTVERELNYHFIVVNREF